MAHRSTKTIARCKDTGHSAGISTNAGVNTLIPKNFTKATLSMANTYDYMHTLCPPSIHDYSRRRAILDKHLDAALADFYNYCHARKVILPEKKTRGQVFVRRLEPAGQEIFERVVVQNNLLRALNDSFIGIIDYE